MIVTFWERLQTLDEDEAAMLLYILNVIKPPGFGISVDNLWFVNYYRKDILKWILAHAKQFVKEENLSIWNGIDTKLWN